MKLNAERSLLLVIDMQARLVPAISDSESLVARVGVLLRAAGALSVPVIATEQSPNSLGTTIAELADMLPADARVAKSTFDATGARELMIRLQAAGRDQIVICGSEAHVCVLQTAIGLEQAGFDVFAVADAMGSRDPANRVVALTRMRQTKMVPVTSEMVIFEWLAGSEHPQFKQLLALIK